METFCEWYVVNITLSPCAFYFIGYLSKCPMGVLY